MEKNESTKFDPNEPDCTNGDFFCCLCLASMNSQSMWSSHIAGKRHIRNAQKFPNGLPNREGIFDEDSYERPAKRERFDDDYPPPYDDYPPPHDDYPPPHDGYPSSLVGYPPRRDDYPPFENDYYREGYYNKRPPMNYEPVVKPNIVFDYGHSKKVDVKVPPSELIKTAVHPPTSNETVSSILGPLLIKSNFEKLKAEVVEDDFFKKINEREVAKELAKELARNGIINTTEKKYDKSNTDIVDMLQELNEKKRLQLQKKEHSPSKTSLSKSSKTSSSKSSKTSYEKSSKTSYEKSSKTGSEKSSKTGSEKSLKTGSEKSSKTGYEKLSKTGYEKSSKTSYEKSPKTSYEKSSKINSEKSSKTSSVKSDCELDDFDPDELTPDILDSLLSARLKPKKSGDSNEICTKKHCPKNEVNLDDPKILEKKLESLPTMEFLNIIHKKLVNIDLKSSDELKLLLKVIAEAQVAVCKKLPPELQMLVKAKLSGNDGDNPQLPAQGNSSPVVSQGYLAASAKSSSNSSSSAALTSSQTTSSVNSVYPITSPQISTKQIPSLVPPTIPNIQNSISQASTTIRPQNQVSLSYPSSVIHNTPTVAPIQVAVSQTPLTSVASANNPLTLQNIQKNSIHNYYNDIFSMYQNRQQNRQVLPSSIQNLLNSQRLAYSKPLPPPPPLPPLPSAFLSPSTSSPSVRSQLANEIVKANLNKLNNQVIEHLRQQLPSSNLEPKTTASSTAGVFTTLKSLEAFDKEYRNKLSQNATNIQK